jgi:hypothetical protein
MNGFSILMLVFGLLIFLCGLYLYQGKNGDFTQLLLWKTHKDKYTKEELQLAGKWTMIVSLIPFILAILVIILGIN